MWNIDKVIDSFISGDYFIIFLILTLAILIVLVLALIKSRGEYNELLKIELSKNNKPINDEDINKIEEENDILSEFEALHASTKEDIFDEDKPLIKQIDVSGIKTNDDLINDFELSEEENAVISREELEQRTQERRDALGDSENQIAIAKYEEEQEQKAIISYEQLVKNASNITLTYTEEDLKKKDAPKVSKINVEDRVISEPEIYIEQEEFLKILKEFRVSLNENIFS